MGGGEEVHEPKEGVRAVALSWVETSRNQDILFFLVGLVVGNMQERDVNTS